MYISLKYSKNQNKEENVCIHVGIYRSTGTNLDRCTFMNTKIPLDFSRIQCLKRKTIQQINEKKKCHCIDVYDEFDTSCIN